jgi:hypothetical protein
MVHCTAPLSQQSVPNDPATHAYHSRAPPKYPESFHKLTPLLKEGAKLKIRGYDDRISKGAPNAMMTEYILKKIADLAFAKVSETLQSAQSTPATSPDFLQAALQHHLRDVKNWSGEISFADLKSAKQTTEAFVPLDLFLQPRRVRVDANEPSDVRPLEDVLAETQGHIIILGQPGAGKT